MIGHLVAFCRALRQDGVRVSAAEALDAAQALAHLPAVDREIFRLGLRAALVKEQRHLEAFDRLFEAYFTVRIGGGEKGENKGRRTAGGAADGQRGATDRVGPPSGQEPSPSAAAVKTSEDRSEDGTEPKDGSPAAGVRPEDRPPSAAEGESDPAADPASQQDRQAAEEAAAAAEALLAHLELGGAPQPATQRSETPSPVPDQDLRRRLPTAEVADLYEAVALLGRRLATRPSRRYRAARRGSVDMRRTLQRGFRSGDAPFGLAYRRRRLDRRQLVVLCDVSGSVWEVSRFFLRLVMELQGQFARTRSLLFVDRILEATVLFEEHPFERAVERLLGAADLNLYGRSDYGRVLYQLYDEYLPQLSRHTVLVVLGDARTNDFEPLAWALDEARRRVRRILWLNPEPRTLWDRDDSVMAAYAPYCDHVLECRDLEQLEDAGQWLLRQAVV